MQFTKEHLVNGHYDWSLAIANKSILNTPDRRFFDRRNGNQILFIINFFGYAVGNLTIAEGQRIEDLILNHLPSQLKSEISVFNWLRGKYLY
jgi:hypothetical protein